MSPPSVRKSYRVALHVQRALAHHGYLLTLGACVPAAWQAPEGADNARHESR